MLVRGGFMLTLLQQLVVNVVVLHWAMQSPKSSPADQHQSVHFSPIPQTYDAPPGAQIGDMLGVGTAQKSSIVFRTTSTNYTQLQDDTLSQRIPVASFASLSTFAKPEPAFQSASRATQVEQQPWASQTSFISTIDQVMQHSDVSCLCVPVKSVLTSDQAQQTGESAQERDLLEKIDYEVYGSNVEKSESPKSRRSTFALSSLP
jgi:hypothetical protein